MSAAEFEAKKEELDEAREPEADDCYEYKLVGCNVHHGSATAGHYWSYINTNRQSNRSNTEEWMRTENDPWMEFNDRNVSPFQFSGLAGRTFGDGASQGTSAYMLFYERVKMKDFQIVVPNASVSTLKSANAVVD